MSTVLSDDQVQQNVSANIRRLLAKRGWTVLDLVRESGEPHNSVYRVCRGDNMPGAGILARIAESLDTTVDFLLSDPEKFRDSA